MAFFYSRLDTRNMVTAYNTIGFVAISLMLSSCTYVAKQETPTGFSLWKSERGYSMAVPVSAHAPSETIGFFTTVVPPACETCTQLTDAKPTDFIIDSQEPDSCSRDITGAKEMRALGEISWGKVTDFGPYDALSTVLCVPPHGTKEEYWTGGSAQGSAAYVLCSEKGNKRVLICISQMTDDPVLAEKIFSTFRWLD